MNDTIDAVDACIAADALAKALALYRALRFVSVPHAEVYREEAVKRLDDLTKAFGGRFEPDLVPATEREEA